LANAGKDTYMIREPAKNNESPNSGSQRQGAKITAIIDPSVNLTGAIARGAVGGEGKADAREDLESGKKKRAKNGGKN